MDSWSKKHLNKFTCYTVFRTGCRVEMIMKVPDIYGCVRKNFFRPNRTVLRERIREIRLGIMDREIPDDVL
jgi:hypothetical protein